MDRERAEIGSRPEFERPTSFASFGITAVQDYGCTGELDEKQQSTLELVGPQVFFSAG